MFTKDEEYTLLPENLSDEEASPTVLDNTQARRNRIFTIVLLVQSFLVLVLLILLFQGQQSHFVRANGEKCAQLSYTPLQDTIEYEVRIFNEVHDRTLSIYSSDPSDEVDRAWDDLYNDLGPSQISLSEAQRLPNKTVPLPADPSQYIVLPTVFHQLHCLNILRKVIHRDYYADPVTGNIGNLPGDVISDHIGHCLNTLKEGIVCAADVSPIVWQWDDTQNEARYQLDIPHTCRRWDPIEAWARAHQILYEFDTSVHAHGHLG